MGSEGNPLALVRLFTLSKTAGRVRDVAELEVDEAEMDRDVEFEVIELAEDDEEPEV